MSMEQLAGQIASICNRGTLTPVLVTPRYLSLRAPFLAALTLELTTLHAKHVRFDWNRSISGAGSFIGDAIARWRAGRINRVLANQTFPFANTANVEITASISRPTALSHMWVVGISSEVQELPAWTIPVFLITSPEERRDASPDLIFHLQSQNQLCAA